ncbi:MAG: XRE family transcriptional regulator [Clostridia bacterium]|nr:XRE family transcriptional regulator [Clostridia bacterium]
MAINYIELGNRISAFRTKKGLSQEEFSEQIGASREHINRIETGKRAPSLDILIDIANVLNVSPNDLLLERADSSVDTSEIELRNIMLDCNETEEKIILHTIKELKAALFKAGV